MDHCITNSFAIVVSQYDHQKWKFDNRVSTHGLPRCLAPWKLHDGSECGGNMESRKPPGSTPSSTEIKAVLLGVTFILHTCTSRCIKAGCKLSLHSRRKERIYHHCLDQTHLALSSKL